MIHLKNNNEVERTKNAFVRTVCKYRQEFIRNKIRIAFQGLGIFYEQNLYDKNCAKFEGTQKLLNQFEKSNADIEKP